MILFMKYILNMGSDNSVFQFSKPGKGKFTLVLQEDERSIKDEAEANLVLERMLKCRRLNILTFSSIRVR
jgi:hypothetical protein